MFSKLYFKIKWFITLRMLLNKRTTAQMSTIHNNKQNNQIE